MREKPKLRAFQFRLSDMLAATLIAGSILTLCALPFTLSPPSPRFDHTRDLITLLIGMLVVQIAAAATAVSIANARDYSGAKRRGCLAILMLAASFVGLVIFAPPMRTPAW